jgi:hypothetical protein
MSALAPVTSEQRDRALEVLLSPDLEPIVDMVGWSPAPDTYEVASADGSARFTRSPEGEFRVESVNGQNPLADQDTARFGDLESERKTRFA